MKSSKILLDVGGIHSEFKGMYVKTTYENIIQCIERLESRSDFITSEVLFDIYYNIIEYTEQEIQGHKIDKTYKYLDWMSDVILYVCTRYVYSGECIPIKLIKGKL